jgi:hypothetical protein
MNERNRGQELTPGDLANLDPYNRKRSGAKDAAKELLGEEVASVGVPVIIEPEPAAETRAEFIKKLIDFEDQELFRVLGGHVYIENPPDCITPSLIKTLDEAKMNLRYIPLLPENYSKALRERFYPNWKYPEDLSQDMLLDWKNSRTFSRSFWKKVSDNIYSLATYLPQEILHGYWIAVEKNNPDKKFGYDISIDFPLGKLGSGLEYRNTDYKTVVNTLADRPILTKLGLNNTGASVRVPTALEYNLLMNRDGLNSKDMSSGEWTYTWTNGLISDSQLVMGFSSRLFAADVKSASPYKKSKIVNGFRIAVDFSKAS